MRERIRRIAWRFVPPRLLATMIVMRASGAAGTYVLATLSPDPYARYVAILSHVFLLMTFMAVFSWAERVIADHIYHGIKKVRRARGSEPHRSRDD